MPLTIEAIYENGVLKPATPLPLPEQARVRLTIEATGDWVRQSVGVLPWTGTAEELQRFAEDPELDYPPAPEES